MINAELVGAVGLGNICSAVCDADRAVETGEAFDQDFRIGSQGQRRPLRSVNAHNRKAPRFSLYSSPKKE